MPRRVLIIDPSFPARLRDLREERGLSFRALGALAAYSHELIRGVEKGAKQPSPEFAHRLDEVLCTGGVLSRLVSTPTTALSSDDAERLVYVFHRPSRVDAASIDVLRVMLADQRHLEDEIGSGSLVAPVTAELGRISELVRESSGPVRPAAVGVAAQWAQFAGWLNTSVGRPTVAEAWFDRALLWATEANNDDLISTVLSFRGHLAWTLGDVGPMIGLTEAARRIDGVYPGEMAYDALQAARGHAVAGERSQVDSLVSLSRDLEAVAEAVTDIPAWHYYRDEAFFHLERGRVYRHLIGVDGYARLAVNELTNGLTALPPGPAHAARYLCDLAAVHALDGDLTSARSVLDQVDESAAATGDEQLAGSARKLRQQIG